MFGITGDLWLPIKDGDERAAALYLRHYSMNQYTRDRRVMGARNRFLIMGPGEKMLLLTPDCRAVFGWRKFIDRSGQEGVNCSIFRNEGAFNGAVRSSDLILAAEEFAIQRWGGVRLYTYVDPSALPAGRRPGYVFEVAGWRRCGVTIRYKRLIFEKCNYIQGAQL